MAGLGLRVLGGALSGVGDAMLEQAKQNRQNALLSLKRQEDLQDQETQFQRQRQLKAEDRAYEGTQLKGTATDDEGNVTGYTGEGKTKSLGKIGKPEKGSALAQAKADLRAGKIDQSEYDAIFRKETHVAPDRDPNDALVQVQLDDGSIVYKPRSEAAGMKPPPRPSGGTGGGAGGGRQSVFEQKKAAWLAIHPDDQQGALDYAAGHKSLSPAEMSKAAFQIALREASANPGSLPDSKAIDERAQQIAKSWKDQNSYTPPKLPGSPLSREVRKPEAGNEEQAQPAKISLPSGVTKDQALQQARAAIAAGKDRNAVVQRLQGWGIDTTGL